MSFQPTVALADLPPATAVRVQVDGLPVAVVRAEDGSVHAVDDTCSHANVSLAEGEVEDCSIECWLHGSRFDLRTGEPTGLPATAPIAVYAVDVADGTVMVDVTTPLSASSKEH
ncbi:MAG TPA: non-heme iron oxygenase ferredoxin subunit [Actinomycetales bacterium]|jgi:3-phenylpropionate/trans-cinnamate dioxygenase ferredoxin subunit